MDVPQSDPPRVDVCLGADKAKSGHDVLPLPTDADELPRPTPAFTKMAIVECESRDSNGSKPFGKLGQHPVHGSRKTVAQNDARQGRPWLLGPVEASRAFDAPRFESDPHTLDHLRLVLESSSER